MSTKPSLERSRPKPKVRAPSSGASAGGAPAAASFSAPAADRLMQLQRGMGNRAAGRWLTAAAAAAPAIQRAISYATPATKDDLDRDLAAYSNAPVSNAGFDHAETLTDQWGSASNTSNFAHGSGSDLLEWMDITYKGSKIGDLRPAGKIKSSFDPNVKMHLVNSFLHPAANDWPGNWVSGHGDLNHDHDHTIEEKAKEYHPANAQHQLSGGEDIYAMSYRTEVKSNGTPAAADLEQDIVDAIDARKPMDDWNLDPSLAPNVKVNGVSIAAYDAARDTAIGAAVAGKVESFLRIYGIDEAGGVVSEDVALGDVEDSDPTEYRVALTMESGPLSGLGAFDPPAVRPKRRRGGPS